MRQSGKPRLLDLFCGAGGAAMGYHRAGFEVVGVDIKPQPNYPFDFIQKDALRFMERLLGRLDPVFGWALTDFAAIHASPPCQLYSDVTGVSGDRDEWPDLIGPTRELLQETELPYVIENVEGAPLENPVTLCGTAYGSGIEGTLGGGLRVIRHRLFESNVPLIVPPCERHPLLYVPDKRRPHQGELDPWKAFVNVTGGGNCSAAQARDAMGIWWMTKDELNEAIPPPFTHDIGLEVLAYLGVEVAA